MNHSSVRAIVSHEVIKMIAGKHKMTLDMAMDAFYSSKTGTAFADDKTDLFSQSPIYIWSLFEEEIGKIGS